MKNRPLKILQLCKKIPYPPKDGEAIAILNISKGLAQAGQEVMVLAMTTPKHHFPIENIPIELQQLIHLDTVYVDTSLSILKALHNLTTQESYNIIRFYSATYQAKLKALLKSDSFDIIQLEGVYLASYIPCIRANSAAKIVMRAHNVEHEIWERLAKESLYNPLKRKYLQLLAKRMKNFEMESMRYYDALVPISVKDEAYFKEMGYDGKTWTLPASVDTADYIVKQSERDKQQFIIGFIGSLDWLPNLEGIYWFVEELWPSLLTALPNKNLILHIAGRNVPTELKNWNKAGVEVLGEVPDAADFMRACNVLIVPLFSGSGMRVKIIEAMALGIPIIATTLAAEGIAYEDGIHLLIGDDVPTFKRQLLKCVQEKEFAEDLGQAARLFIEEQHETGVLIDQLIDLYQVLLK